MLNIPKHWICYLTGCVFLGQAICQMAGAQSEPLSDANPLDTLPGYVLPLTYDPLLTPAPVIQARINGSEPLPFVIDTGLFYPVFIDKQVAAKLGLRPNGETVHNLEGKKIGDVGELRSLDIVGSGKTPLIQTDLQEAGIVDLGEMKNLFAGPKIAGVLGAPLFATLTARFDFVAKTLTIYFPAHAPLHLKGAVSLPLKPIREGEYCQTVPLKAEDGTRVDVAIDTGSVYIHLPFDILQHFSIQATAPGEQASWTPKGIVREKLHLLASLRIGDRQEPDVLATRATEPSAIASLGMDFLSRFRVTLDLRNKQLTLEPAADYEKRIRQPGVSDIALARKADYYVAQKVPSGSAPALAGIRRGDKILMVDGYALDTLPLAVAQRVLNGFAGTRAEVTVEHADKQRATVSFERAYLLREVATPKIGVGIEAGKTAEGRLLIIGLEKSGPAQEAGLQVEDEIVEINGEPIQQLSRDQLAARMRQPEGSEVRLKIRRKGESTLREYRLKFAKLR